MLKELTELTSELAGQYIFSDTEFVQNLSKHSNIFQKVYDEIKHLYKMATAGSNIYLCDVPLNITKILQGTPTRAWCR